jgi:hypothetical protein
MFQISPVQVRLAAIAHSRKYRVSNRVGLSARPAFPHSLLGRLVVIRYNSGHVRTWMGRGAAGDSSLPACALPVLNSVHTAWFAESAPWRHSRSDRISFRGLDRRSELPLSP